jgi:hypothetical protein
VKALRKRSLWILLTLILLPILASFIWYGRQIRQQRLDRALIEAIKKDDTKTAIALLDQGADANVTDRPEKPVTLPGLLSALWNRIKGNPPPRDTKVYPSALLLPYSRPNTAIANNALPRRGRGYPSPPKDNPELVKALLEHGANPYAADELGASLLHKASGFNHIHTVQILLEHHVDPDVKAYWETTPLMRAEPDCARLLIAHGADVNAKDRNGSTPLMFPYNQKYYPLLIDHKADINAQDKNGRTVLMCAVGSFRDAEMVRCLLRHGARVSQRDRGGRTALDYAHSRGDANILHLLEAALKTQQAQKDHQK